MRSQSLLHDCAWATSRQILQIFAPLLREEEQRDAFEEIYTQVKAGLECFEILQSAMGRRINPSRN